METKDKFVRSNSDEAVYNLHDNYNNIGNRQLLYEC